MVYTKKEERLYKQYEKENNLMFPLRDGKTADFVREEFIRQLIASPDFRATYTANDKMMQEPIKKIIQSLKTPACILFVSSIGIIFGGITTSFLIQDSQHKIDIKNIKNLSGIDVAIITFALLLGVLISEFVLVSFKQLNQESSIDSLYHRASIRLFNELKKYHPELKEHVLKSCNPEMARVIKALLIANMSEQDAMKIREIAFRASGINTHSRYNSFEELKNYDKEIQEALKIVEKTLLFNEPLKNEVLNVYRGNVPATFVLNQTKQNVK